ncbi:MAG: hypothetical protein Q4D12_01905 [Bacteroidales bacterium]|nr:hypothetical protein [Bacteroidales bacterium]
MKYTSYIIAILLWGIVLKSQAAPAKEMPALLVQKGKVDLRTS